MSNPFNPLNRPSEDEEQKAFQGLLETVPRCERLLNNPDFQWFRNKVFMPDLEAQKSKACNLELKAKEIKNALRVLNALRRVYEYPVLHAQIGRAAITNYEEKLLKAQKCQPDAKPPLA